MSKAWLLLLASCTPAVHVPEPAEDPLVMPLRWVRGYDGDTWERSRDGLLWGLSDLGAVPGDSVIRLDLLGADTTLFTLDLSAAGFPEAAMPAVVEAVSPLRESEEVALFGGMDVGRFLMNVLYEPWRYYAITGACPTLGDWQAAHLGDAPLTYAITESMLVDADRLVTFQPATGTVADIGFVVADGPGSIEDGSFESVEFDTVDVMPSLQQRFAAYDASGELVPSADPALSPAGQPGRCMWCHEMSLHRGLETNPTIPPHIPAAEFETQLAAMQASIDAARGADGSAVNWDDYDVHEWGELLVGTFLSPTPGRLAREWSVPEGEIVAWLAELPTHPDPEFTQFGEEYTRADVDAWYVENVQDYSPIATLPSARDIPEGAVLDAAGEPPAWGCAVW